MTKKKKIKHRHFYNDDVLKARQEIIYFNKQIDWYKRRIVEIRDELVLTRIFMTNFGLNMDQLLERIKKEGFSQLMYIFHGEVVLWPMI